MDMLPDCFQIPYIHYLNNLMDKFNISFVQCTLRSTCGHNNNLQCALLPLFTAGHYVGPYAVCQSLTVLVVELEYLNVRILEFKSSPILGSDSYQFTVETS